MAGIRDNEYVVCPHCGEKHGDAWEWCASESAEEMNCQECEKPFWYWADYSVDYVTHKPNRNISRS